MVFSLTRSTPHYVSTSYAMTHLHTYHTYTYVATYMQMQLNTRHYPSPLGLYAPTRRGGLQLLWHLHFLWHFRYAIQRRVRTSDWRQPGGCRWCCYLGNKQKRSDWDGECKCAPRMKALWLTFRPLIKPSKLPTERERELCQDEGRRDLSSVGKPVKASPEAIAVTLLFYDRDAFFIALSVTSEPKEQDNQSCN